MHHSEWFIGPLSPFHILQWLNTAAPFLLFEPPFFLLPERVKVTGAILAFNIFKCITLTSLAIAKKYYTGYSRSINLHWSCVISLFMRISFYYYFYTSTFTTTTSTHIQYTRLYCVNAVQRETETGFMTNLLPCNELSLYIYLEESPTSAMLVYYIIVAWMRLNAAAVLVHIFNL